MHTVGCSGGVRGVALALSVLAASPSFAGSARYSVRDLGVLANLAGREESKPYALNNRGQIAAANVTGGVYRAFLWNGSWTNIGTLGGGEAFGFGINDDVGVVGRSTTAGGLTRAFLWTMAGTNGPASNPRMRDLGTLGGPESQAFSINSATQITGYAQTVSSDHAFRWSNGDFTDIGAMINTQLERPWSYGYAINGSGQVTGEAYAKNFKNPHAFLYTDHAVTDLGDLGGGQSSALSINSIGHVVGYSTTTGGVEHAFIHDGASMIDLGTLGGLHSYAQSINRHEVVVGGSFVDPGNSIYHAFLYADGSMTDLNGQLDASGAGWTLIEARAVNDVGQIAGIGRCTGVLHGFILNPLFGISDIEVATTNVIVMFTTVNRIAHALEASDSILSPNWTSVVTNIVGNGASVVVTNSIGAEGRPRQYYRVGLVPP